MSEAFVGEIQQFGFNFPPRYWATCNGAVLPLQQYMALYSLIGTTYGGNGVSTFQLPNLSGRAACSQGNGPGLSARSMGSAFGTSDVTLSPDQMPAHNHLFAVFGQNDASKRSASPGNGNALSVPTNASTLPFIEQAALDSQFSPQMIGPSPAQGQPHTNMQPYLATNFCIALDGVFPSFD